MAVQVTTQKKDIVTIKDFNISRENLVDPYETMWVIQGKLVFSYQDNDFIVLGTYWDRDLVCNIVKELDEIMLKSLRNGGIGKYEMYENKSIIKENK